jgi:hypothetical protein
VRSVLAGAFTLALLAGCAPDRPHAHFEVPAAQDGRWYKGSTHTHTTNSDGDSPPEYVARWYKEHGYDFLVLTDHNVFTDPATLAALVDSAFLLVPGEELTSSFEKHPVHVNGLNIPGVIERRTADGMVATIQANVDAVRAVGAVPQINHPNFGWAFGAAELAQIQNDALLEIFNGHPSVHNAGGGDKPGLEEIWDTLLGGGARVWGVAVDDAHHFQGEFSASRANPGRGWVVVRATALEPQALVDALAAGGFYASTGVELSDVVIQPDRIEIHIAQVGDFRYTTTFIGAGGRILARTGANPAVYELGRDVGYVRAKVVNSAGYAAWTQPAFVARRGG